MWMFKNQKMLSVHIKKLGGKKSKLNMAHLFRAVCESPKLQEHETNSSVLNVYIE